MGIKLKPTAVNICGMVFEYEPKQRASGGERVKKWDEMTARERDALVQEKVFGNKIVKNYFGQLKYVVNDATFFIPDYTTELADALIVADKFQNTHLFNLTVYRMYDIAEMKWYARFDEINGGLGGRSATSYNLADAICHAVIRTIQQMGEANGRHSNG